MEARAAWRKIREWGGVGVFVMVTALFVVWLVFGTATTRKQSNEILLGVRGLVTESLERIEDNQQLLVASARYTTCVLQTLPENRRPTVISRCARVSGLDKYLKGEVKHG